MPDVYGWPPVSIVGHEHTISRPGSTSRGLSGTPYFSQSEPTRRMVQAVASGIGSDLSGAGYIEQLKWLMDGALPLVRFRPLPQHWINAKRGRADILGALRLNWTDDGTDLDWTADAVDLNWTAGAKITGTAGTDGTWNYLDCTGFPVHQLVVVPSERVTVDGTTARALRPVTSDVAGEGRIWLDGALPSGSVTIGQQERIVFRVMGDFPRARQPVQGTYSYTFEMLEVFASEFAGGFTVIDPWN